MVEGTTITRTQSSVGVTVSPLTRSPQFCHLMFIDLNRYCTGRYLRSWLSSNCRSPPLRYAPIAAKDAP